MSPELGTLVVLAAFGRLLAGVALVLGLWPTERGRRPRLVTAVVLGAVVAVLAIVSLVLGATA